MSKAVRSIVRSSIGCVVAGALGLLSSPALAAADLVEPLAVRINGARGVPGGEVVIVLRTYSSRPVKQGRLTVVATKKSAALTRLAAAAPAQTPFADCSAPVVFSVAGDAVESALFDLFGQSFEIDFSSASASINGADGVLAAFTCLLDDGVVPGDRYDLELSTDAAANQLLDPLSGGIVILPKPGELRILDQAETNLGIDDLAVKPGALAILEIGSETAYPIESGQIEIAYDPTIASGKPTVIAESRHGSVVLGAVTYPAAGHVRFQFTSPDSDLNTIPGTLFRVQLPTVGKASLVGSTRALGFVGAATHLEGPLGVPLGAGLENGTLTFDNSTAVSEVFQDGFGTGTSTAWSVTRP